MWLRAWSRDAPAQSLWKREDSWRRQHRVVPLLQGCMCCSKSSARLVGATLKSSWGLPEELVIWGRKFFFSYLLWILTLAIIEICIAVTFRSAVLKFLDCYLLGEIVHCLRTHRLEFCFWHDHLSISTVLWPEHQLAHLLRKRWKISSHIGLM